MILIFINSIFWMYFEKKSSQIPSLRDKHKLDYRSMFRIGPVRGFSVYAPKTSQYTFYDLATKIHRKALTDDDIKPPSPPKNILPQNPIPSFQGAYKLEGGTAEERISRIFGGRLKGEPPQSSSRFEKGQSRLIAGIEVPAKPVQPDNCCMSGCINCVWELYNDDVKDWEKKRKEAARVLHANGGEWPEDFDPPSYLSYENLPPSLKALSKDDIHKKQQIQDDLISNDEESSWENIPISMKVFAQMEKKIKEKHIQQR